MKTKKKPHLLLVDDEQGIRGAWKNQFKKDGYIMHEAESGEEALKELLQISKDDPEPILVILLDVVLPKLGGIEILKRIKGEFPFASIFVISGNPSIDVPDTAFKTGRLGGDYFYQKTGDAGFDFPTFKDTVKIAIKEQEAQWTLFKGDLWFSKRSKKP